MLVQNRRDKKVALRFFRRLLKDDDHPLRELEPDHRRRRPARRSLSHCHHRSRNAPNRLTPSSTHST
ncbi:hypothetical protein [Streptomyces sp. NWU339]|uniref:hypothetical protein n=1 Tax=Streptomyces sp. NWU339 TaxID=2185284 RepID=UPI0035C7C3F2